MSDRRCGKVAWLRDDCGSDQSVVVVVDGGGEDDGGKGMGDGNGDGRGWWVMSKLVGRQVEAFVARSALSHKTTQSAKAKFSCTRKTHLTQTYFHHNLSYNH